MKRRCTQERPSLSSIKVIAFIWVITICCQLKVLLLKFHVKQKSELNCANKYRSKQTNKYPLHVLKNYLWKTKRQNIVEREKTVAGTCRFFS